MPLLFTSFSGAVHKENNKYSFHLKVCTYVHILLILRIVMYCLTVTPPLFATYFHEKEGGGGGGHNSKDIC